MKHGKFPKIGEIWRPAPWTDGSYRKDGWVKVMDINLKGFPHYDGSRQGLIIAHGGERKWKDKKRWFYPCVSYQYFIDDMHAKFMEREDIIKKTKRFVWPLEAGEHIHDWFELSYAQYLTIPRSVLQSMPATWQKDFTRLLEELDETYDWRLPRGRYRVQLCEEVEDFKTQTYKWGAVLDDPFMDYERGRRILPKEVALEQVKTCDSCGGMKRHHHDHAPKGFEKCSRCSGTGKTIK